MTIHQPTKPRAIEPASSPLAALVLLLLAGCPVFVDIEHPDPDPSESTGDGEVCDGDPTHSGDPQPDLPGDGDAGETYCHYEQDTVHCESGGEAGTIHWQWDSRPNADHCAPHSVGDSLSPGWCGAIAWAP